MVSPDDGLADCGLSARCCRLELLRRLTAHTKADPRPRNQGRLTIDTVTEGRHPLTRTDPWKGNRYDMSDFSPSKTRLNDSLLQKWGEDAFREEFRAHTTPRVFDLDHHRPAVASPESQARDRTRRAIADAKGDFHESSGGKLNVRVRKAFCPQSLQLTFSALPSTTSQRKQSRTLDR